MTTVIVSDLSETKCIIKEVDLRYIAGKRITRGFNDPEQSDVSITQYRSALASIIGNNPTFSLLLSSWEGSKNPFFREICAYLPEREELYITSNLLQPASSSQQPVILITKARLSRTADSDSIHSIEWQKLRPPQNMTMPAGGAAYRDGVLFCSQGNTAPGSGGLYYMALQRPPVPMVTNYFGCNFNSVHAVAVAKSDGALWFTDPCHGADRGIRQSPQLPCQVYRYYPQTGDLRVVADGLGRPHGIALSPDDKTVYITDSDAFRANQDHEPTRAATTYAFDVVVRSGGVFLANKRVFAYVSSIPMCITCDSVGNVYIGCAAGVEIFNAGGGILGVIEVPGGVSSLTFGKGGELFLCSEQRLWRVKLDGLDNLEGSTMSIEDN